jgi:hypothetical protein
VSQPLSGAANNQLLIHTSAHCQMLLQGNWVVLSVAVRQAVRPTLSAASTFDPWLQGTEHHHAWLPPPCLSTDERPYYFNVVTGESSWEAPEELAWQEVEST